MKRIMLILGITMLVLGGSRDALAVEALKKTIAVYDFENDSGFTSLLTLGQDFSTQLTDALVQSGKFTVLTRQEIVGVMAEQDMASSDRFAKSNSAGLGKIVPAQILVKGKLTEFQEKSSGGGQGFGIYGVSINTAKTTAHVAVIIQLINTTTGEVIDSQRVEGDASTGGASLGYAGAVPVVGAVGLSSSNFQSTPLGKAVQITIDNAVDYISKKSIGVPWSGKVMMVKEGVIYVNSGTNTGIKEGDTFFVYKLGEALTDPDSGMELGRENTKLGQIKITEVQDKFSKSMIADGAQFEVSKGDLVSEK